MTSTKRSDTVGRKLAVSALSHIQSRRISWRSEACVGPSLSMSARMRKTIWARVANTRTSSWSTWRRMWRIPTNTLTLSAEQVLGWAT